MRQTPAGSSDGGWSEMAGSPATVSIVADATARTIAEGPFMVPIG
jgi:hypothetical protein